MTELEQKKIAYCDASIQLEIATNKYNEAKRLLVEEMQKASSPAINKEVVNAEKRD